MRLAYLLVGIVAAGCASAAPTPTVGPIPTSDPGYVTKAEYGDGWPFTVPAGSLHCYDDPLNGRKYVTFSHPGEDGVEYAVNGSARDLGYPELDKQMMPALPNRVGLTPLIERGLELCDG